MIPHCRNSSKIQSKNHGKKHAGYNYHKNTWAFTFLTGTWIKYGGIELVLWAKT